MTVEQLDTLRDIVMGMSAKELLMLYYWLYELIEYRLQQLGL